MGMVFTPLLFGFMSHTRGGGVDGSGMWQVFAELLLPFALGHLLRPWIGPWAARNKSVLAITDRGSILIVVYTAFSAAVAHGIWHEVPPMMLGVNGHRRGAAGRRPAGRLHRCPRVWLYAPPTRSPWCLRFPKVAGCRHSHRQRVVCRTNARCGRAADHDLPPAATRGVRVAGAALRKPPCARGLGRGGSSAADKRRGAIEDGWNRRGDGVRRARPMAPLAANHRMG